MEELHHIVSEPPELLPTRHRRKDVSHADTIQIVESELPISEADNYTELGGVFLFRQLCAPCSTFAVCLFCNKRYLLMRRDGLAKHYYVWHGLRVVHGRAKFHENVLFLNASDLNRLASLTVSCTFCDVTLSNVSEVLLHYYLDHGKEVRFFPEAGMVESYSNFHCGICGISSDSFGSHCDHLYFAHNRMTYCCKYCKFYTANSQKLYRHVRCHYVHQNGLNFKCSACCLYLRGTEVFVRHLRKYHALQIGESDWCCSHCCSPYDMYEDLLAHLPFCPDLDNSFKQRKQHSTVPRGETCRCCDCAEDRLMKLEIKRLRDSLHIGSSDPTHDSRSNKDINENCIVKGIATQNLEAISLGNINYCADGTGEAFSMNLIEKIGALQKEQTLVHCSSRNDSRNQIVCGGCLMYFGSEDQFAEHDCTEKAF